MNFFFSKRYQIKKMKQMLNPFKVSGMFHLFTRPLSAGPLICWLQVNNSMMMYYQRSKRETFAASEWRDLSGFGSDVIDDGILEPGDPKNNKDKLITDQRSSKGHQCSHTHQPHLKCSPSARTVSICIPPILLKIIALCPPSTRRHKTPTSRTSLRLQTCIFHDRIWTEFITMD